MKLKIKVPETVKNSASKLTVKLAKVAPDILVVAGVVGTVAGVVLACKSTLKVNDILTNANDDLDLIKETYETVQNNKADGTDSANVEYEEKDYKKDLAIVYVQTAVKIVKLYAPSIAVLGLSITSILGSHKILNKRNAALTAAYTAVDKGFKEYRKKVVEELGEDKDLYFRHGIKAEEVEVKETDEKGKEKTTKKTVTTSKYGDGIEPSIYAKFFDSSCKEWSKDPEYNLSYLLQMQNIANEQLISRGHLFLNEVYDMLGIERTKIGQVVGWIYDEKNPIGDNCVDFGIYNLESDRGRAFVNGYEPVILLDFNVDGDILSNI